MTKEAGGVWVREEEGGAREMGIDAGDEDGILFLKLA